MFVILSKLLPLFIYPLGLATLLLLGALLLQRPSLTKRLVLLSFLLLWLGGNRWVAYSLTRALEWRHLPEGELPALEVAVVLGGSTRPAYYPRPAIELRDSADRLLYAAQLYHAGKADYLLLTGGGVDWLEPREGGSEAQNMAAILGLLGVPPEAMWLETEARNTYENAVYSRAILAERGVTRALLVTSARHMPRSVLLFEQQGVAVVPAPADFLVTQADWEHLRRAPLPGQLYNLLPNVYNLALTTEALKELIGIVVYGLRGG